MTGTELNWQEIADAVLTHDQARYLWTVEVRRKGGQEWSPWIEWVDRATAEAEKVAAAAEGYFARIVASS